MFQKAITGLLILPLLALSGLGPRVGMPVIKSVSVKAEKPAPPSPVEFAPIEYTSPLEIPLTLAGNFGEPRRLHFHTGLDFRTDQKEGLNVHAVAEGYVSRINVSGAGYGNALYITHPNGSVSVYGHLQIFAPKILARLRKEQYAKENFTVDFNLAKDEIKVAKGEIIALSGNTGGSGGPHLHFEIRDSLENTINPMKVGFTVKDTLKPTLNYVKFYPLDEKKFTCDGFRTRLFGSKGNYSLTGGGVKVNAPLIGIAINCWDAMQGGVGTMGVYKIMMFDNSKQVYEYKVDQIAFTDKRYVLSHVDYPIFMKEKSLFHKCFVDLCNKAPLYCNLLENGTLNISDGKQHYIEIIVSDYNGNTSVAGFNLQYDEKSTLFQVKPIDFTQRLDPLKENTIAEEGVKATLAPLVIFDTIYFKYSSSVSEDKSILSKVHQMHKGSTLVFDWYNIAILANVPKGLEEKALIVYRDDNGGTGSKGGTYKDGWMSGRTREFGAYYVRIDTTAPRITPTNIVAGRNMRKYSTITFKISDNLSGIKDFDTYLDDKWTVSDYDAKSNSLIYYINKDMPAGEHTFKVVVTDEKKNTSQYSVKFLM
jgi:hypothetical protein